MLDIIELFCPWKRRFSPLLALASPHFCVECMLHVPYRSGAQALTDVIGRQVQVNFATIADAMEHIKAGRLRALAVTGATRTPALPDVPTIGEFVPGYEAIGWLG